jgi:peptide/nickel transport system substrate-binding protein
MVDRYTLSDDGLKWTFTLRDGLIFHDGASVTSEDVIASLQRWGLKDATGQKLMRSVKAMTALDAMTFEISLSAPTGLMLLALGKPSSNVPFIMPKRMAQTPAGAQIKEHIGSGPFLFKLDEWKPGDRAVYLKFDRYKPRDEQPSGLAGGHVAKVDRVEWLAMPDQTTAVNALIAGEIDLIEVVNHDLLPTLERVNDVRLVDQNPLGNQLAFRFNVLHKPFDNPKVRAALYEAFNQEDFLQAVIGNPKYYKVCKAMFICGSPLASEEGMKDKLQSNVAKAKAMLKEAGYDGTPVVLLHSTEVLTNLAPVAKSLMERAGFKVDMQSSDWQTLVARRARKELPSAGGWNGMLTSWVAADLLDPVATSFANASCDNANYGWPCDEQLEKLREQFAQETDAARQKTIANAVQQRIVNEYPTHVFLGQWYQRMAHRANVSGIIPAAAPVFWNVDKR